MIVASLIGWISFTMIVPWISANFDPKMISAFLSGNGITVVAMVLGELIQEPGTSKRITPTQYFLMWSWLFAASLAAGVYIVQNVPRTKPKQTEDSVIVLEPWRMSLKHQMFPAAWRVG